MPPICKRLTGGGFDCEYAVNRFSIGSIIGAKVGKYKGKIPPLFSKNSAKFYFLKMQQLNKICILETVAFVREKRTRQYVSFGKKT